MIAFLYELQWGASALHFLRKQRDKKLVARLHHAIEELRYNPRPSGCKKLRGSASYRIRVGDYRIIYEINGNELIILVLDIGHRREVYR